MAEIPPISTFVGRRREFDELSHHVTRAAAGRGCLVTIGGEPGLGKT